MANNGAARRTWKKRDEMTVSLSKTSSVLDREPSERVGQSWLTFSYGSDRDDAVDDARERVVRIDRQTFYELGSPQQITVTIEPGDLLNP